MTSLKKTMHKVLYSFFIIGLVLTLGTPLWATKETPQDDRSLSEDYSYESETVRNDVRETIVEQKQQQDVQEHEQNKADEKTQSDSVATLDVLPGSKLLREVFPDPVLAQELGRRMPGRPTPDTLITQRVLDSVTNIFISNVDQVKSIKGMEYLRNASSAFLSNNPISDFSPLANLKSLGILNIDNTKLDDTSVKYLAQIKSLTSLEMRNNAVTNIDSLFKLPKLTNLHVTRNNIDRIRIDEPTSLVKSLTLNDNNLSDARFVRNLPHIQLLDLTNNKLSRLTGVESSMTLEHLYFNGNQLTDLTPISNLTNLKTIEGANNTIEDLTPFTKLTQLTFAYFPNNKISDLTPFKNTPLLEVLYFSNNEIQDISPLKDLTQLNFVNLNKNHIANGTPLVGLPKLEHASLQNQEINAQDNMSYRETLSLNIATQLALDTIKKAATNYEIVVNLNKIEGAEVMYDPETVTYTLVNVPKIDELSYDFSVTASLVPPGATYANAVFNFSGTVVQPLAEEVSTEDDSNNNDGSGQTGTDAGSGNGTQGQLVSTGNNTKEVIVFGLMLLLVAGWTLFTQYHKRKIAHKK